MNEVLGHLVVVDDLADAQRDLVASAQRPPRLERPRWRSGEFGLGRCEQTLALARALLGEQRVLAGDQSLTGVVRVGDLEEVRLIEQAELDGAAFHQGLDRGRAQRGDEVQLRGFDVVLQTGLGEHPAVPHQTDVA